MTSYWVQMYCLVQVHSPYSEILESLENQGRKKVPSLSQVYLIVKPGLIGVKLIVSSHLV